MTIQQTCREIAELLAQEFDVPPCNLTFGHRRASDTYWKTHWGRKKITWYRLHLNLFNGRPEEDLMYALLHEFAHHLTDLQHGIIRRKKNRISHGHEFCDNLAKVILAYGQNFNLNNVWEYKRVKSRLLKSEASKHLRG